MIKQHKLPTIIAIIILVLGVASGVFLVQRAKFFETPASPEETPQQVRITNISNDSFTLSWVTSRATPGFVSYGKSISSLDLVAQQGTLLPNTSLVHSVLVSNLTQNTTYFFKIGSGNNLFDNSGQPYQITTAAMIAQPPQPDIIFGTINNSSGLPSKSTIVYVTVAGVTPLSALADDKGSWTVPLSTARSSDLKNYASYNKQSSIVEIFAQGGGDQFATAKVKTESSHPVPSITLGKNHDFTDLEPVSREGGLPESQLELPELPERSSGFSGIENSTGDTLPKPAVVLLSPKTGESVNTNKPQFSGTGSPGTVITIMVESTAAYTGTVTVPQNGQWKWTPSQTLEPGNHKVTISWKDASGKTQTLERSFVVLAQGSSNLPAFTASESGAIATASPSPSPSPSPTSSPSASQTPRVSLPSTESGVPVSGNLTPLFASIIMGVILILTGLFLPRFKIFN